MREDWHRLGVVSVMLFHFLLFSYSQTNQQWRDSLNVLNKQIAKSAWSTDLHLRKAAVNMELHQWEYAATEYSQILEHEPQHLSARYYRAYANSRLRRYDLARRDYEDVLREAPQNLSVRLGLSNVLQQLGHKQEAIDQLNLAVEQHPDSAVTYASRAALERDMQQFDAALYDWEQAMERDGRNTDYVASCVDLYLTLGLRDEARRALDKAVERGIPRGMLREWYRKCGKK
jgi:tetratricopeptide (TPR) repeat protein